MAGGNQFERRAQPDRMHFPSVRREEELAGTKKVRALESFFDEAACIEEC